MAVDYQGYMDRVQRNARLQQPDIAEALTQAIQMRRQGEAHDQRLKLSDLEMQRQQMDMDRLGRKAALEQRAQAAFLNAQPRTLSSLNPAYVSPEKFQEQATTGPPQMNAGQDYNLDYGFAANSSQPIYPAQGASQQEIASLQNLQPRELTTTQPADPYGDAARVYAEGNDFESAKNLMTMQDVLAQAKAHGDPETYYRAKLATDDYEKIFAPRLEKLLQTEEGIAQIPELSKYFMGKHPKDATMFDVSDIEFKPDGFINPLKIDGRHVGDLVRVNGKNVLQKADATENKYLSRQRPSGRQTVFEESNDGGKTWKEVSRGEKDGPKISISSGSKEKDLPAGIQDKISSKLEMYNDWSTLKDTFKPEFIPKTPFKSVNEFKIKMDKVFKGNQEAIDWWTRYFDSRNLLLKDRSGAAITEPEFVRFEQGSIAANTNPQTIINYLDRSVKKYGQHKDAYLTANEKNHPESVKAFRRAYGDTPQSKNAPAKVGKYTYTVE